MARLARGRRRRANVSRLSLASIASALTLARASVTYEAISQTYALTSDCSSRDDANLSGAAKSSVVTCGPSTCTRVSTTGKCSKRTEVDIAQALSSTSPANVKCGRTCAAATATTDPRCSSAWMAANLNVGRNGNGGIVAAWCNEKYFVVAGSMAPGFVTNMNSIPQPPGGTDFVSGAACVTGDDTVSTTKLEINAFPLYGTFSLLADGAATNNMASFPNGAQATGSSDEGRYFNNAGFGAFGLPADGGVGITVTGQSIYPTYSNTGAVTLDSCEVDSCNEHVGQGGGQPHLHGDPFSATTGKCLYSPENYTSSGVPDLNVHPPLIGFSYDGPLIYGRHLSPSAPGFSIGLDACGGHEHDAFPYHYHTQIFQSTTTTGHKGTGGAGRTFPAFTPGPAKCWRADISTDSAFWTKNKDKDATGLCTGTSEYWLKTGYSFPSTSCVVQTVAPSSSPSPPVSSPSPPVSSPSPPVSSSASSMPMVVEIALGTMFAVIVATS